jgi:hypothetical protein
MYIRAEPRYCRQEGKNWALGSYHNVMHQSGMENISAKGRLPDRSRGESEALREVLLSYISLHIREVGFLLADTLSDLVMVFILPPNLPEQVLLSYISQHVPLGWISCLQTPF